VSIDLNADVGESFGPWPMGEDDALIPLVSSVNVACGFHAGDPVTMERTVGLAVRAGCAIGAHPGYPDLVGFGRRDMAMSAHELEAALVYQVGALGAFARAAGTELRHVKAHGALYNLAGRDEPTAEAIVRAVRRVSTELVVFALPGSPLIEIAGAAGLKVAIEAFADRVYESDGSLRSRRHDDAVLDDPASVAAQAVGLAQGHGVRAIDGTHIAIAPDTVCVHGDRPGAADRARAVRDALLAAGITIAPPG
jgi:5-oxoprolinase (ATP-hydrolysing) subunit A